jgi:hypothetical protein
LTRQPVPRHWDLLSRYETFEELAGFVDDLNYLYQPESPWQYARSTQLREDGFGRPIATGDWYFYRFAGRMTYHTLTVRSMKAYLLMLFDANQELWDVMLERKNVRRRRTEAALDMVINRRNDQRPGE